MDISEPTEARLRAAAEFICEGRCVDFRGVGLVVAPDGRLRIDVSYSGTVGSHDEECAKRDIRNADKSIAELFAIAPDFESKFGSLPRKYLLIHSDGKSEVELGQFFDGELTWCDSMRPNRPMHPTAKSGG